MLKRGFRLAGLTLLFGALLTPAARADTRFDIRVGVPGRAVVAPYASDPRVPAGPVWQPGYYVWAGYGRRWVPGRWIGPAYGYRGPAWPYERRGYDRRDWHDRWERGRRDWHRDREWRR
jgi:hypothetical protein